MSAPAWLEMRWDKRRDVVEVRVKWWHPGAWVWFARHLWALRLRRRSP